LHVGVLVVAFWLAIVSIHRREAREAESRTPPPDPVIAIELPAFSEGALLADRDEVPEGTPPEAHGGATTPRVDEGTAGHGGSATGARATNLAASDEGMRLNPDLLDRLDRDQTQRLKTAPKRTTHEDRRATTNPMEVTFLATGKGEHAERRPNAPSDPSRGSLAANAPSVPGGHPGTRDVDSDDAPGASQGSSRPGQLVASPGVGVRDGAPGDKHSTAARVALGRPSVTEGPPTIPAVDRARPNDTVDSDQAVASTVRSLVHASVAGAAFAGDGRGGSAGPESDPGAGGTRGRGSIARPLGAGDGEIFDWYTSDPNLLPYFRRIHAKVDPLWANAFPKSAMLELKQGTVIFMVTVSSNGAVALQWPPARPSGIEEFDRNVADAIRRASPFDPLPASLGRSSIVVRMPFVAKNPIIK
jgi:TonB family protein